MQSLEVEQAYAKASDICEKLGDGARLFEAKWGLWINANLRRKTALARGRATELVSLAQHSNDGELLLEAYHCQWSTAFFQGDAAGTVKGARQGIALYDIARHRHLGHQFGGHDPGVCGHVQCGNGLQLMGEHEGAASCFADALALAERLEHPNTLAHGLHNASMGRQLGGDREATYALADRAVTVAERFGLPPWRASSIILRAWASATAGDIAEAERQIDAEIGKATAGGPLPQYYMGLAAEVLLSAGRPDDGLVHLDRAIAGVEEDGIGFYLPEIHRLRGACLLAQSRDNKADARSAFVTALDIARRQGAMIFERSAAAALAELGGARSPNR
jgi:tetratricopeptide (TPR) repeat protein